MEDVDRKYAEYPRHSRVPWKKSDGDRWTIISRLLMLSNRFGGLKHRSVIWLFSEYDFYKRSYWEAKREIEDKNKKIKEISIELSKYKRQFGKLDKGV